MYILNIHVRMHKIMFPCFFKVSSVAMFILLLYMCTFFPMGKTQLLRMYMIKKIFSSEFPFLLQLM